MASGGSENSRLNHRTFAAGEIAKLINDFGVDPIVTRAGSQVVNVTVVVTSYDPQVTKRTFPGGNARAWSAKNSRCRNK